MEKITHVGVQPLESLVRLLSWHVLVFRGVCSTTTHIISWEMNDSRYWDLTIFSQAPVCWNSGRFITFKIGLFWRPTFSLVNIWKYRSFICERKVLLRRNMVCMLVVGGQKLSCVLPRNAVGSFTAVGKETTLVLDLTCNPIVEMEFFNSVHVLSIVLCMKTGDYGLRGMHVSQIAMF